MSYVSHEFWTLICNAPDCNADSCEGSDYAAWAKPTHAEDDARDAWWVVVNRGDDSLHYCPDHRRYVCGECDKSEGREYPLDHEGMCDECWAEDQASQGGER